MKKPNHAVLLFAAATFVLGLSVPRVEAQGGDDLAQRVSELEAVVKDLRKANEAIVQRMDQTSVYLEKQAAVTKSAILRLDESESLGFTKGMNYQSREVLLAAFRTVWTAQQDDVPRKPAKTPAARDAQVPRRR